MKKLQRYLGLLVALLLIVFVFQPIRGYSELPPGARVTPLDNTLLSVATSAGHRSNYLWRQFADYVENCSSKVPGGPVADICIGNDMLHVTLASGFAPEIARTQPHIQELIASYKEAAAAADAKGKPPGTYSREARASSEQFQQARYRLDVVLTEYLDAQRPAFAGSVYALHGLAIALFLLMVWRRESVGGVVLWPLTLFRRGAKAAGAAAKTIHEKV